ncbi:MULTISPECIES: helicase associated domain-containing protein [unclassified Streptomyces]
MRAASTMAAYDVRLGVWVSNQKMRRDQLSGEQLALLAGLGMGWA